MDVWNETTECKFVIKDKRLILINLLCVVINMPIEKQLHGRTWWINCRNSGLGSGAVMVRSWYGAIPTVTCF